MNFMMKDIISLSQQLVESGHENWLEFTEGQLKEWGVKYHELEVGKKQVLIFL